MGPTESHGLPLHGVALTETVPAARPQPSGPDAPLGLCEGPPPLGPQRQPGAARPFSWALPHPGGRGWGVGGVVAMLRGLEPPPGLPPELPPGPAAMPLRRGAALAGTGSPCLLAEASRLPFLWWERVTVTWGVSSLCTRRVWTGGCSPGLRPWVTLTTLPSVTPGPGL